jgi:hypothetical protein
VAHPKIFQLDFPEIRRSEISLRCVRNGPSDVEIAEEPFAIDRAKSLDLQEFGRGNMIAREEGNCRPWRE